MLHLWQWCICLSFTISDFLDASGTLRSYNRKESIARLHTICMEAPITRVSVFNLSAELDKWRSYLLYVTLLLVGILCRRLCIHWLDMVYSDYCILKMLPPLKQLSNVDTNFGMNCVLWTNNYRWEPNISGGNTSKSCWFCRSATWPLSLVTKFCRLVAVAPFSQS